MAHKEYQWWSDKKKLEVVTTYLLLGKVTLVAASTDVPEGTIRRWMVEPWWKEMVDQIQQDSDQELDAKLEKRLQRVLDVVADRLENGDFMFNPKEGVFVRRPVSLKDGWKVGKEMFDIRQVLRKQKPEAVDQAAVGDILRGLAAEFAEMAKKRVKEKTNHAQEAESPSLPHPSEPRQEVLGSGTKLPEGVRPVSGEARANPEKIPTEQSPSEANEGGPSSERGR